MIVGILGSDQSDFLGMKMVFFGEVDARRKKYAFSVHEGL